MDYHILKDIEQPWPISAQCFTGVWVSPRVRLAKDDEGVTCVWHWTVYDEAALRVPEQASLFAGRIQNRPYQDRLTGDPTPVGPEGWDWERKKVREDKLAKDFLNLARNDDPECVRRFAARYGPLWLCRKHVFCHWDKYRFEYLTNMEPMSSPDSFCEWDRKEPVAQFQHEARIASAAFAIWQTLREGKKAPLKFWQTVWDNDGPLGEHAKLVYGLALSKQQQWLAHIITKRVHRRVNLTLEWRTGPTPQIVLNTEIGFFPVVWRTLAQRIAGGVSLYTCSGCQSIYFRTDHKPPGGRNNFCPKCKDEGTRISKRLWAQKSRREQREARLEKATKTEGSEVNKRQVVA
jgi:hypothetical protein